MNKTDPLTTFTLLKRNLCFNSVFNGAVFGVLEKLKKYNPGDTYLEAYRWHLEKRPESFVDFYHLLWTVIGPVLQPLRIMEIGCRTGISICQLLSAHPYQQDTDVVLFDIFNDGFVSPEIVKMNLNAIGLKPATLRFVVGNSLETVPEYVKEAAFKSVLKDYILVDGCHDKPVARQDLENVVPLLAEGGVLFFDDIAPDGCALLDVWEDFKASHKDKFFFVENFDGKGIGIGVRK